MFELTTILAASSKTTGFTPATLFLPILLIGGLYFLLIRPQRRQQQQQKQLSQSLDVGDEVMTSSGIIGTIVEMDDDEVMLEVAEGVELRLVRQAVSRKYVYDDEDESEDAEEDDDHDDDEPEDEHPGVGAPSIEAGSAGVDGEEKKGAGGDK